MPNHNRDRIRELAAGESRIVVKDYVRDLPSFLAVYYEGMSVLLTKEDFHRLLLNGGELPFSLIRLRLKSLTLNDGADSGSCHGTGRCANRH